MQSRIARRPLASLIVLAALAFRLWYCRKAAKTVLLLTADWGDAARIWTTLASVAAEVLWLALASTSPKRGRQI